VIHGRNDARNPLWIASADGGLKGSNNEPCIDRAADGITYNPTGPGIEDRSQVHKAGRDCACAKTTMKCVALWESMVDNPACPWVLRLGASDRLMERAYGMPLRPITLQADVATTELKKVVHEVRWMPPDPADRSAVTIPEPD
jgi:hypothetical protein